MIDPPQELKDWLLDRSGLFDLRIAVEQKTDVAEDEDVGENEPKDKEGVRLSLLVCTVAFNKPTINFNEDHASIYGPSSEKGSN